MSQSQDDPLTPKPKTSSTGMFGALKTFAGQGPRYRRNTASPASGAAVDASPTTSASLDPSTPASVPRSVAKLSDAVQVQEMGDLGIASSKLDKDTPLIGGPDELQKLVEELGPEQDIHVRIRAAKAVTAILVEYPVFNIGVVWKQAKDILRSNETPETFDTASSLLVACVKNTKLEPSEKRLFFDSISNQKVLDTPGLGFLVLAEITQHGKYIEGLELGQLLPLVARLLSASYDNAVAARKKAKTDKSKSSIVDDTGIKDMLGLVLDTIKFNAKVFEEDHLQLIIEQILSICRKTPSESDLKCSLNVIEAVVTYASIPMSTLRVCVEVLCGMFCSIDAVKAQSLATFWKLLNSHLGQEAMQKLLDILSENPQKSNPNANAVRGAVQIFREIMASREPQRFTKPALSDLLTALRKSLGLSSARLQMDILNLLHAIVEQNDPVEAVFEHPDWDDFVFIMVHCSDGQSTPATALQGSSKLDMPAAMKQMEPEKEANYSAASSSGLHAIFSTLFGLFETGDSDRKRLIMSLFLVVASKTDDKITTAMIEYYAEERLLLLPSDKWIDNYHQLRKAVFQDSNRSTGTRLKALQALNDSYSTAAALNFPGAGELVLSMAEHISEFEDVQVLGPLVLILVDVAVWTRDYDLFRSIVSSLREPLLANAIEVAPSSYVALPPRSETSIDPSTGEIPDSLTVTITKGLVRIFLRTVNRDAEKAEHVYASLLQVAGSQISPPDSRITALKCLVRIRCDANFAIFITQGTESERVAAALCRTADTVLVQGSADNSNQKPQKNDDQASKKKHQSGTDVSSTPSRTLSNPTRTSSNPGRITRPLPPTWMYPGPRGLPEEPSPSSSRLVYCSAGAHALPQNSSPEIQKTGILRVNLWLELVLDLLQRKTLEWETYSYIIVHLGAQLMNHSLFLGSIPQIKLLRSVLYQQLQSNEFHEPPAFTNLKKSDVAICLYHILTSLVSFKEFFSKNEEDEMVRSFALGIGSWERSSEICIHALSVCCHELPMSIVKCLDIALQKLAQIITQANVAVHILEFLSGLARLPELFRNFREEEFRKVFGICFRYLQYVRDQRGKIGIQNQARVSKNISSAARGGRDSASQAENMVGTSILAEVLPQYVYALTYHVMTFWFIALKRQDRPRQLGWIRRNLIYHDDEGREIMEEQSLVTVDLMHRVAFSDRDETIPMLDFAKPSDGPLMKKSFLVGYSILTVETAGRTGVSHITIRRPSGTKYSVSRPNVSPAPRHQVGIHPMQTANDVASSDYVNITADDIVQSLYSPLGISPDLSTLAEWPIPLPDDEATTRSLNMFDRIPALDGHKVGILYVGENQTTEAAILANTTGSADYIEFLNGLGTLTELKGATLNTQGLDREYDTDGKFTYCWRDRVSELVFHVATMMPTNLEHDPQCTQKKQHVGNDFVNIIFNNSGQPYNFDTLPSDFNYVNIVITPEARASFVEAQLRSARIRERRHPNPPNGASAEQPAPAPGEEPPEDEIFYKVTVVTKAGLPKVSPAAEAKIISGRSLPAFARLLALNASVFASVWANRQVGEHVSSWRSRLREIVKLREKHRNSSALGNEDAGSPGQGQHGGSAAAPAAGQAQAQAPAAGQSQSQSQGQSQGSVRASGRESGLLRRVSAATFFSESGTSRSSGLSAAPEMERSSSNTSHE